jgi:hypothetical protein
MLTVKSFKRSTVAPAYATARLVGPKRSAYVVARCVGTTWTVVSGVVVPRTGTLACATKISLPSDIKLCP